MEPNSLFPEIANEGGRTYSTGVLTSQDIKQFLAAGYISSPDVPILPDQIQPASLDLRLGATAYRVGASFLPGRSTRVAQKVDTVKMYEIDLSNGAYLETGCIYIVPLMEELRLPKKYSGVATPKSTTGRLDIFTRVIADYTDEFEKIPDGYRGKLFLEITPRTFSVIVRQGDKLNQLRIRRGARMTSDTLLERLHEEESIIFSDGSALERPPISRGLWLSLDLRGSARSQLIGYKAKRHAPEVIDLSKIDYYDAGKFWEPIYGPVTTGLMLHPDDFYLLASKEKIRVPPDVCAEMVPYDTAMGEFRVHYAGFFDPGFGYGQNDGQNDVSGTCAVLEVRSHEIPFLLEDGQRIGRLMYERLLSTPDKLYGAAIGSSYQRQGLALAKQFKRPPGEV